MDTEVRRDESRPPMRPVTLKPGESHLSRLVTEHCHDGRDRVHELAVVAVTGQGLLSVRPYAGEQAFILYHDRPLHLFRTCRSSPRLYEEL